MYNPNNYELPDHLDSRLTEYIYSYDVLFTHAVAFSAEESDRTPYIELEFYTLGVNVDFNFMMWPETPAILEAETIFDLEQLNPDDPGFSKIESEIASLMKLPSGKVSSLDYWYEQGQGIEANKVGIVEYRVRFAWEVRAWDGLTLEHLKSEMDSAEWALDFSKGFIEGETFILLDTFEPEDSNARPEQLVLASDFDETEFEDLSKPGWSVLDLSEYLDDSESDGKPTKSGFWSGIKSLFRRQAP